MEVETIQGARTASLEGAVLVTMSREEALLTIASLTNQLIARDPNIGREDFHLADGKFFSILVIAG